MSDNNSQQTNDYFKNLNKHNNCSKCSIVLNRDNYKRRRTVCKLCYNNNVLLYYKNKFGSDPASKTAASTQTDFSDQLNSLNKQIKSKKRTISKELDIIINNIADNDPNLLCDKLKEILSKPDMLESDYTMSKMILDELLKTKCISKKDYIGFCKNIRLV